MTTLKIFSKPLSNLAIWSHDNNIKFNATKCKVLSITRKKNPVNHNYQLNSSKLLRVKEEKDLGVIVKDNLSWDSHIHFIIAKANKMLGLLKRTCPMLTDIKVRRTLYLSLVKSQLCYATVVWSPHQVALKAKIERVQRRATRWILRTRLGDTTYKERLQALHLLPLCYDREVKDLTFFYKALYGHIDLNITDFVVFSKHSNIRNCLNPRLMLKVPFCNSITFQASYFNRIVKLWNPICKSSPSTCFSSIATFKHHISVRYFSLLDSVFDIDRSCTWSAFRECPCHRG